MIDLDLLEIHAAHACDLTCESCSHFSGEGHRGVVTVEQAIAWSLPWASRIRPRYLGILGGEPTLNPHLAGFIDAMAAIWPHSRLRLTTNGLAVRRHKTLGEVLARHKVDVCLSIHHDSADYLKRVEHATAWLRAAGAGRAFGFHVRDSYNGWTRRYRGRGADVLPYDDTNPRASWERCPCRWARQLYDGRLWKCSTMAYLHLHRRQFGALDPAWTPYLAYDGLSPAIGDLELRTALSREDEPICGACPAHSEPFRKPDPTVRLSIHRRTASAAQPAPTAPLAPPIEKVILFTVAAGEAFARMAAMMAFTARRVGLFSGPIIVFSDLPLPPPADSSIQRRPIPPAAASLNPHLLRAAVVESLPPCEAAIYADADILFRRPIAPLLALMPEAGLAGFGEGRSIVADVPCFNNAMTDAELADFGQQRGINSGFLIGRRDAWADVGPKWIAASRDRPRRGERKCFDQPVLNAMAAAGQVTLHHLPNEFVGYPNMPAVAHPPGPACIVEHFACGGTADQMSQRLSAPAGDESSAERRPAAVPRPAPARPRAGAMVRRASYRRSLH